MNEEISGKLKELVLKGIEIAEQTGKFVIDQAPELLQEFYAWAFYGNLFWIILGCLIIIGTILLHVFVDDDNYDYSYEDFILFAKVSSAIISCIMFFVVIICTYELVQLAVAPKLYLIEYLLNK